ncbi:MAG: AI-2E family transporter [Candidatus Paceibacterota bacterium]|jgi:predicted PurR-regulated permease PerM
MDMKILRPYFLATLIIASSVLVFFVFRPFLIVLILAGIFALLLRPLYLLILRHMSESPGLAASATILISVVCVLAPLLFISVQIAGDAQHLYTSLSDGSGKVYLDSALHSINESIARSVPSLSLSGTELSNSVDQYIKNILTWLVQNLGGVFGGFTRFLLDSFIFLIALYYLLRDGAKLKKAIIEMSPLADAEDKVVFARLELAVQSVIRGSLMIAILQGILTGIGFAFSGIPNSILWGVVAAFSALIPGIGTSLVLAPGVAYLFLIGATTPAIGLLIWSVVAVGLIDNFLGPRLVGRGLQLHPLLVLLSVFGGLAFFGPAGIFLGPLCTSLLFALLSIYQHIRKQAG